MLDLDLASRVGQAFERIHHSVFLLDPTTNPKLKVEVVDAGMAGDTPTLIVITPWTLSALAFPPDDRFPPTIEMSGREYAAYPIELPEVGQYRSVNLAPDVSRLPSAAHARKVARLMAPIFRDAVEKVRRDVTARDPSRRRLLSGRPTCVDDRPGARGSKGPLT
jgi:[NiFe]-hydrogenase assembly, chaperone, HybE